MVDPPMASLLKPFCIALLASQAAAQQIFSPVNASYGDLPPASHIELESYPSPTTTLNLVNLTLSASESLPSAGLIKGTLDLLSSNNTSPSSSDIAVISCDPEDFSGNIDNAYLTNQAIGAAVQAIVVYSTRAQQCNLTGNVNNYSALYSTASTNDSLDLLQLLQQSSDGTAGGAIGTLSAIQGLRAQSGQNGTTGNLSTGGASTAVAMIVLYSITGVITALFLLIIITGALRAHRHPERYGPRNEEGAPRQSRARGIARAMLDTIPIVKFGESNTNAPKSTDVELGHELAPRTTRQQTEPRVLEAAPHDNTEAPSPTASNQADHQTEHQLSEIPNATDGAGDHEEGLVCSICTEEFEKGQDARVLPCKHKFHPACVDPWLLDVSGTCPLCRIDLRSPDKDEAAGETATEPSDGPMPPPLDPPAQAGAETSESGGRLHALLRRMQPRTPEERLEALRLHREENLRDPLTAAQQEQHHESRWQRARRRIRGSTRMGHAPAEADS